MKQEQTELKNRKIIDKQQVPTKVSSLGFVGRDVWREGSRERGEWRCSFSLHMELPVVLVVEDGSHYKDTEERSQERERGLLPTPALHFCCTPDEKRKGSCNRESRSWCFFKEFPPKEKPWSSFCRQGHMEWRMKTPSFLCAGQKKDSW